MFSSYEGCHNLVTALFPSKTDQNRPNTTQLLPTNPHKKVQKNSLDSASVKAWLGCGGRIWTNDLRVMRIWQKVHLKIHRVAETCQPPSKSTWKPTNESRFYTDVFGRFCVGFAFLLQDIWMQPAMILSCNRKPIVIAEIIIFPITPWLFSSYML